MMSRNSSSRQGFEVFCDSHATDGEKNDRDRSEPAFYSEHLRHLSVSQSQNRKLKHADVHFETHELNQICRNPNPIATQKSSKKARRIGGRRLTRPSLTYNTFEVLNTVSESDSELQGIAADSNPSDDAQKILELSAEQYSTHPLSVAARHIPPLEEQLSKHCDGFFEWILAVNVPSDSISQRDTGSETGDSKEIKKLYFGCNLLPKSSFENDETSTAGCPANRFLLLITPLKETKEVLEVFSNSIGDPNMALTDINSSCASIETLRSSSSNGDKENSLEFAISAKRDTKFSRPRISVSPAEPVARIEDSFEALDQLEEQLEAFGNVAHLGKYMPSEKPSSSKQPSVEFEATASHASVRFATPQPTRTCMPKLSSASLRIKPASEPRKPALRKANSMMLDSPKLKAEDKALAQTPPTASTNKGGAALVRQRSVGRLANRPYTPAFEPHGGCIAQQSQERKDSRLTSQRATQPTAASLRRAKSAKLPTRPTFELPGEAISRRKREEHQAQLRAQEEEERKRREFKARPPPSKVVPTTAPRETIASRARQTKATMTENISRTPMTNKYAAATIGPHSRSALLSTVNQQQVRGRGLKGESSPNQASRATSASTGSVSGKRSSVSYEDAQMQKLRGHEIYKRDNSWTDDRARERQQREQLAKLAREEAAERSRQQSREWAARQARKRATISSLRDVLP